MSEILACLVMRHAVTEWGDGKSAEAVPVSWLVTVGSRLPENWLEESCQNLCNSTRGLGAARGPETDAK